MGCNVASYKRTQRGLVPQYFTRKQHEKLARLQGVPKCQKRKRKKKEKNLIHMLIWKCITQVTCFLHTSSLFVLATGFHLYSTYPRRRSLQLLQNLLFIHKEHA